MSIRDTGASCVGLRQVLQQISAMINFESIRGLGFGFGQ